MDQQNDCFKIPENIQQVGSTWLSKILKDKISENDLHVTPHAHDGIGFLSNYVLRVQCRSEEDSKVYNLIIKLLIPKDIFMRELARRDGIDKTEIGFYEKILPDLISIVPDLKDQLCEVIYCKIQKEPTYSSVIVLEDLKFKDYYMIPFGKEFISQKQLEESLDFLAKIHFAGYKIEDVKKESIPILYPFLQGIEENPDTLFFEMIRQSFEKLNELFGQFGEVGEKLKKAYGQLAPYAEQVIQVVFDRKAHASTLIHGDLWSNNLLFNDKSKSKAMINWQFAGYADQTYDVAVLILSSIPKDQLNEETVMKYLKCYYNSFVKYCREGGCEHAIRDRTEFSKFFKTRALSYAFLWFAMKKRYITGTNIHMHNCGLCTSTIDLPRLISIYEYLIKECKIPEFLMNQIKKK